MKSTAQKLNLLFPTINTSLKNRILEESKLLTVQNGDPILDIGVYIQAIPLVIDGALKVIREDDEGNELYLYHIIKGESCAITLTSLFANEKSKVRAVAVEETHLIAVPSRLFKNLVHTYPDLYDFVLETYHQRFNELLSSIDSLAFRKIDRQIIKLLKERSKALDTSRLLITHQQIADELNTSREVISRLLKQLEKQGKVQLSRNCIEIIETL